MASCLRKCYYTNPMETRGAASLTHCNHVKNGEFVFYLLCSQMDMNFILLHVSSEMMHPDWLKYT